MATVLIADDEANLRKVLSTLLSQDGHDTHVAEDGLAALRILRQTEIDVLVTDLRMPGLDGLQLLEKAQADDPSLPVIVITAHGSVDTAVSALKKGACDYITKPFDKEELRLAVRKAIRAREKATASPGESKGHTRMLLGQSVAMHSVLDTIAKVAPTPSTVLISGGSGTGKELVATAIHEQSDRADKPLIKVNCAAIPKDLMESEFFGHEKGAFTGAVSAKPGRFELAHGGTLFLDEIGETPLDMQVKLLRALQEGEFQRVGGLKTMTVDVRVVAATNRDLAAEVAAGNFREDLYYRLNVVPIAVPSLKDRREDIPTLVDAFVKKHGEKLGSQALAVGAEAMAMLCDYPWPGNVRELENLIERTVLFAEGETIVVADLPEHIRGSANTRAPKAAGSGHDNEGARSDGTEEAQTPQEDVLSGRSMKEIVRDATQHLERDLINKALKQTGGNVTRSAHLLGISRKGLQLKMRDFGLRDE